MSLAEADYGMTEMAFGQDQNGPRPGDEKLLVRFLNDTRHNPRKSKEEGRPIHEDCVFVDIRIPGDRLSQILRPANQGDYERFPQHYAAFQARHSDDEVMGGTPLKEWPAISRGQVEELAYFHVRTVEQLVNMTDGNAQNFRGMASLRQKAEAWLAATGETKAAEELNAKLVERDNKIESLNETVSALMGRLAKLEEEEA